MRKQFRCHNIIEFQFHSVAAFGSFFGRLYQNSGLPVPCAGNQPVDSMNNGQSMQKCSHVITSSLPVRGHAEI